MIDLNRKATPWVSRIVLLGCICVTTILVYVSHKAIVIGNEWVNESTETYEYK